MSDVTLERFFVLYLVRPFVGYVLIVLHIFCSHLNGSRGHRSWKPYRDATILPGRADDLPSDSGNPFPKCTGA